ncbi:hypothetical protein [Streptomyces sp. NBC_00887]|uniref:hypothetical protein n=1 Tax=Streptomyces sp. NBC_00887 TaxID=2975859 RepID=UPI00386FFA82|nr:hypothetical protein OG844_22865 [Streptomyces sp. NBC_00887]
MRKRQEQRGWVRRRVAVLVTVLGLGVLLAPSAVAGGQTSVLVTSPSSGEAAALYVSDPEFGRLSRLLGPPDKGDRRRPASLDGSSATRQINVTWMALDLQPTRTDRVFPGSDPDTVWIHTAAQVPATYRGLWHRAAEPKKLIALLDELGLMGRPNPEKGGPALYPGRWESESAQASSAGARAGDAPAPDDAPSPGRTDAAAAAAGDDGPYERLDHWWWAIPGLAMGAALAPALRSRGGRREPGRRQELLDR